MPKAADVQFALCPGERIEDLIEEAMPRADIWPDNLPTVNAFIAASNQWRVWFGGPYALDYNVLPIVAPESFKSPEWTEILEGIRVMEEAALATMRKQQAGK
jgi:uncharacterized protein DUF1799